MTATGVNTSNYYYGARYYNPKTSIWLSVDKMAGRFPSWSPYNFCLNNPINLVDPDGNAPGEPAVARQMDRANRKLMKGEISEEEWHSEHDAIGWGGMVGVSLVSPVDEFMLLGAAFKGLMQTYRVAKALSSISKTITKGASKLETTGFKGAAKHLAKRQRQGYDFKNADELAEYGQDFFKRSGDDIEQFKDAKGYVHRVDNKTQEYGLVDPDGNVVTVMKVKTKENSEFKNASEYLKVQHGKYGE